ncbi:hypothetical protein OOT46_03810 [Aquabacterium sp. A7-Y]|uniref:FHA domain-containing protein n=1 Tax=Aquabacterium sp. A7-Y TaxID=1349605 RepID=UPI00223E70FE|nr:FHA domain-containing protein [Aquabacterium sp. A7-Y]MCW7536979.1 hypothetical protein [Aquabacterium sp. A7-Y]
MQYEFRVLSGLHRGAALPLTQPLLSIGSDDAYDVVLVDAGVAARAAQVQTGPGGWRCVFDPAQKAGTECSEHAYGEPARIGPVWVTVCGADAPWDFDHLPQPAEPARGAAAETQATVPAPEAAAPTETRPDRSARRRALPVLALALLAAGIAGAYAVVQGGARPETAAAGVGLPAGAAAMAATQVGARPTAPAASAVVPAPPPTAGNTQLQERFRHRLAEAELSRYVDVEFGAEGWVVKGGLGGEDIQRFGRVLAAFIKEQNIRFPVEAKITEAEDLLPFRIREFSGGPLGSVVLTSGERLYVGDLHAGYRLASIQGRRIVFDGRRRVEVNW